MPHKLTAKTQVKSSKVKPKSESSPSKITSKVEGQVASHPKKQFTNSDSKPKIVGFMSMSGYTSTYNSKSKKPITVEETYQVFETNNGKIRGFYEQRKDGKTVKKQPIDVNKKTTIKSQSSKMKSSKSHQPSKKLH